MSSFLIGFGCCPTALMDILAMNDPQVKVEISGVEGHAAGVVTITARGGAGLGEKGRTWVGQKRKTQAARKHPLDGISGWEEQKDEYKGPEKVEAAELPEMVPTTRAKRSRSPTAQTENAIKDAPVNKNTTAVVVVSEDENKPAEISYPTGGLREVRPTCLDSWEETSSTLLGLAKEMTAFLPVMAGCGGSTSTSSSCKAVANVLAHRQRSEVFSTGFDLFTRVHAALGNFEEISEFGRQWTQTALAQDPRSSKALSEMGVWFQGLQDAITAVLHPSYHKLVEWLTLERALLREFANLCAAGVLSVL